MLRFVFPHRPIEKRRPETMHSAARTASTGLFLLFAVVPAVRGQTTPGGATASTEARPIAKTISPTFDMGKIVEGQKYSHSFQLTNAGNAPLQILRVVPDCSCTQVLKWPTTLAPGETGSIDCTLDATRLLGPFIKGISVQTNDPATPTVGYTFSGDGRKLVEVMPVSAGFGRVADSDVHETVITLTNRSDQPMKANLESAKITANFEFELLETIPGIEYKLVVVLRPPFREGTLNARATISTNITGQSTITVPAVALVLPRQELSPNTLFMGDTATLALAAGKPVTRVVEFFNRDLKPLKVLGATCDDPAVKVSYREVDPGKVYRVLATFPPDYRPPAEGRNIVLATQSAEQPEIKIPIRLSGGITRSSDQPGSAMGSPATSKPTAQVEPAKKPVMELVGKGAPPISLTTAAGLPVNAEQFKHYPVTVLNFVAPDCPFCKRQLPNVEKVRADFEPRGVRFVNVGETLHGKAFTQAEAQGVFDTIGSRSELAMDPGNLTGAGYKITSFPILVLVDKSGTVVDAFPGARTENTDKLRTRLSALLQAESGVAPGK